jgi:hypothetical protein
MSIMIAVVTVALATAATAQEKKKRVEEAGVVSLDVQVEGNRVHLLIGRRQAGQTAKLQYLRSEDGGATWSLPVAVGEGQPAPDPIHRGMDAQIAAAGDRIAAVWTTRADTRMGRGPLVSAVSIDGGKTWKPGPSPSDSGEIIDHAFIDVAVDAKGAFHCVWLDGRGGIQGKGLRYAQSSDGGASWSKNSTIDDATCECCWNRIIAAGDKLYVLYRDSGPRDMALAVSADAGRTWTRQGAVGAFNWDFNGCPHVGGGLAVEERSGRTQLHAVVWTAQGAPSRGAFTLGSADDGKTWSAPSQLGSPESWRPDIAVQDGRLVAVWDAYNGGPTSVFVAISAADGEWSTPRLLSGQDNSASVPRIVTTPSGVRAFWTEREAKNPVEWKSRLIDEAVSVAVPATTAPAAVLPKTAECVMCTGHQIPVLPQTPRVTYKAADYFFCSELCKETFEKRPEAYLKAPPKVP